MSLTETLVSFNEIEKLSQRVAFEYGRSIISSVLEELDEKLRKNRDKTKYGNKGKRPSVIKTTLGEVSYSRTLYYIYEDGGKIGQVYLLDELMGMNGSGHFSELLRDLIVRMCCDGAYRDAARAVSEMTGQAISHTAAWNIVQAIGKRVDEHEHHESVLAAENRGAGTIETGVLFEEQDGVTLNLQGEDRKKHGDSKEMKVAIAYDGAVKKGKDRYELTNKVACANFESVSGFVKRKEGVIAGAYNVDEIEVRFLNGDGAAWIKQSKSGENVHIQLDQFHRNKAITRNISNPKVRETITELLYAKEIDLMLHVLEVEALSSKEEDEREKYMTLHTYFTNNKEGLVPITRRGLIIPAPTADKEYRSMGCMESNIYTIIGNRMKGGRACWSINGGNNLARLLCLRHTQRLSTTLQSLSSCVLPERYTEETLIKSNFSAAQIPPHEGKGYNGFKQTLIPSNQKWLKDIAAIKPLYSQK